MEKTVKWLWDTANHLDFTLPSASLISRYLRELSVSGRTEKGCLLKPVGEKTNFSELCPHCLTPWSAGHYMLRLIPSANGKKRKRSLLKLLKKQPSTLNKFQIALLDRIKNHSSMRMRLMCLVCKKATTIRFSKTDVSFMEKFQKKTEGESFNSYDNTNTCDPLTIKRKKKKRKKDALCGLKKSAVSQAKKFKLQHPTSAPKSIDSSGSIDKMSNLDLTSPLPRSPLNLPKDLNGSKVDLPLVNPNKLIESHGKIKKSLEEIFSNLEKDDVCDSVKSKGRTENYMDSSSQSSADKIGLELQNSNGPGPKIQSVKIINNYPKSDNAKQVVKAKISKISSLRCQSLQENNNKRSGNNDVESNVEKIRKSLDEVAEAYESLKLETGVPGSQLSLNEASLSVKKGIAKIEPIAKKVNLFSQPLSNSMIQSKICTVSNNKSQSESQSSNLKIHDQFKKPLNTNIGNEKAPKPKSNVSINNQNTFKRKKKKSKSNQSGKKFKTKNIIDKVLEGPNSRNSLSICDLLNLT